MNKKRITSLTIGLFGVVCGLVLAHLPASFIMARADEVQVIDAGYCSTVSSATKTDCKFEMLANDAPLVNYQPQSNDCVTLKRDGRIFKLSTDHSVDMISKSDPSTYVLDTSSMGEYAPRAGDVYTIKGQFLSHDDGDIYTGKYILNIFESSFVVSEDTSRSYFVALPQRCVDGGEATMPPKTEHQWHFLFNLYGLEKEDAPVTGDNNGAYYPTSTDDVFVDGVPVAKIGKKVLKRRDKDGYLFYVCYQNQSDYQNWTLNVGSILVFDGTFIYKGDQSLPNNQQIGFSLNEVAFRKYSSAGMNDYEVINFRQYLYDSISNTYDAGNYSGEAKAEVARILADLENDIFEPETVKEVYQIYNDILTRLASYAVDPDAVEANLKKMREEAVKEIQAYPNLDDYFPAEQETITNYISEFIVEIETKTNKSEIVSLVSETKAKIDAVKAKKTVVIETVEKSLPGYEKYLNGFDRVSLNNINLDSITYHCDKKTRDEEDLNTNPQENNALNTYVPSRGNDKCNVVFQFKYEPLVTPVKGSQLMVVLRGTPLRGYKVGIDTNTRGCFLQKVGPAGGDFIGGTSFIFANGGTYIVEIGAIDLVDYDLTWIFVRVNDEIRYSVVTESLGICVNPRIAICPDDGNTVDEVAGETCVISDYNIGVTYKSSEYVSAPKLSTTQTSTNQVLYCLSQENDIPHSTDLSYEFYPASPDAITLTRGLVSENVANVSEPIVAKTSESEYQINIKDISIQNGDTLTIQGRFSYFDNETKQKVSFIIGKMALTYDSSVGEWSQSSSFDDYKEDAKLQLEYFVDLDDYDPKIALAVSGVIAKGKRLINQCASQEEVDTIVSQTKAKILRFKTSLDVVKVSSVNEIKNYKKDQINEYRLDEQKEIETLKADAIAEIISSTNVDEVLGILDQFKQDVDGLKTSAQYEKEELDEGRNNGIKEIRNHYASLNINKLSVQKREKLNQETEKAVEDLRAAESVEEINRIVKGYKSAHPINKINGGIIAIIVVSSVAVVSGIGLLVFFLVRRRRKTA